MVIDEVAITSNIVSMPQAEYNLLLVDRRMSSSSRSPERQRPDAKLARHPTFRNRIRTLHQKAKPTIEHHDVNRSSLDDKISR